MAESWSLTGSLFGSVPATVATLVRLPVTTDVTDVANVVPAAIVPIRIGAMPRAASLIVTAVQIGRAIVFDDKAVCHRRAVRGLEKMAARTRRAAVVSAIDRFLDVDARDDFHHLGRILIRDGGRRRVHNPTPWPYCANRR